MNTFELMKKTLAAGVVAASLGLAGCHADGDNTVGPGNGGGNGGSPDGTGSCVVPLGDVCISGAEGSASALLDDALSNGPLAPIAKPLADAGLTDDLQDAVQDLLANDGNLGNLVESLLLGSDGKDPNLELALAALLDGGLQDILTDLLGGDGAVANLLGPDGIPGLIETLLVGGKDQHCQAAVGTLCLIGGNGGKIGLVEALITQNGNLTPIADGNIGQDDLVAVLGDVLENPTGGLNTLLQGLLQEGNLVEGLQTLLDPNQSGSLADAIGDALLDDNRDQNVIQAVLNYLSGLLGAP